MDAGSDSPLHAPRVLRELGAALLLGLAFYLAGRACIALPREGGVLAPMWFPNAVALAALLRTDARRWPLLVAASLAGNLAVSMANHARWDSCLALAASNMIEYLGAAFTLRRLLGGDVRLDRGRDLALLAGVGALAALTAAVAAGLLLWLVRGDMMAETLRTWAMAHPLGLLLVTPCLLTLSRTRDHLAETPPTRRGLLGMAALAACACAVFSQSSAPILFMIPPALLFVGLELGVWGAATGVLMVTLIAVPATLFGHGPIALTHGGYLERDAVLQLFLVTALFASLPVASLQMRERRLRCAAVQEAARAARAEAEAATSEARYRLLAEKASDTIVSLSMAGEFEYLSPSVETLTGFAPAELVGRPVREHVHPDDYAGALKAFEALMRGPEPAAPIEYRFRRKDGRWIWLQVNPQAVRDPAGRAIGFVDIARDVTARKAMEAELHAARRAAEAAAAAKAEFLANMSHELRTPLTAVLGFAGLVAEQPELSPTSHRYLDRVRTAGKALLGTVNDVLDFSRLEAGQIEIVTHAVALPLLGRESLELFEAQAAAKGLALQLVVAGAPPSVEIDEDRVRQVLVNLIGNAVKFTAHGEVRLEVSHADDLLTLAVVDTGPGVAAEQIGLLFQRFSQVDGSSTRRHGGSGLGLAICKGLVEAMGGVISVESAPGAGSTFRVRIPAPVPVAADGRAVAAVSAPLPGDARILVADDTAFNRELVIATLSALGLSVDAVAGGEAAVEAAASASYDLVLMDLRMPGMDGRAAAERIRAAGPNARTPIIAFSADVLAGPDPVFDGALAKPLSPSALVALLAAHLPAPREVLHVAA